MRGTSAVALWVWAFCILCWIGKYLDPVPDWKRGIAVIFELAKCVFLVYVGISLIDASKRSKISKEAGEG